MSAPASPAAPAPTTPVPSGGSARLPHEDLPLSDKIFLGIENPVLRRELLTALRSNKAFVLQFLYLAILGGVIYLAWPTESVAARDQLILILFRVFGQSQLVLLSVMSPAFSASAMTIEKERRCMDLLLTSPIRPGTILMGKYLSSVVYLFLLILSSAPVVSVLFWLAGVDPESIAGLYLLLFSVAGTFGMIGLASSVFFHRSQTSLAITYMAVLPLALLLYICSEFNGFFLLRASIWPSAFLISAAFVLYQTSLTRLRQPFDPVFKATSQEDIRNQTGLVLVRDRFPDNLLAPDDLDGLLPDSTNPMYQKEIRSEIFGRGTLFLRLIIQISMFLSVVFLTGLYMGHENYFVYFLIVFTMLVAPAFACNTITQERERGTLDLLLTTLIRPSQIVLGKFFSCLRLSIFLTGLVGVTLLFYLFMGQGPDSTIVRVVNLSLYIIILVTTIVFETSLAMFFSLVMNSTVRSMITTYGVLLVLFATPVAAVKLIETFTAKTQASYALALMTSPFMAVYSVAPKSDSGEILTANSTLWPYYLAFCAVSIFLAMGFVLSSFARLSMKASNNK